MDIWEKLYQKAKEQYHPQEVSPFIYAHHVVCALESENGEIYTGFCIESCAGVMDLCAERVAALNMYIQSQQTVVKRMIAFRDQPPFGKGSVELVVSFLCSLIKRIKTWKLWWIIKHVKLSH